MTPARCSRASAKLVFPTPPWPTRATLRILSADTEFTSTPMLWSRGLMGTIGERSRPHFRDVPFLLSAERVACEGLLASGSAPERTSPRCSTDASGQASSRASSPSVPTSARTGITADHLTVLGIVMATAAAVTIGSRLPPGRPPAAGPDRRARPARRCRGQGLRHGVHPRRLLRLGLGPRHRRPPVRRRGLVPADRATAAASPCCPSPSSRPPLLISYERAKAESLGFDARGGLMERAERFILLGLGLLFERAAHRRPVGDAGGSRLVTAVQRFVKVWRQADRPPAPTRAPTRNRRRRSGTTRSMARPSGRLARAHAQPAALTP